MFRSIDVFLHLFAGFYMYRLFVFIFQFIFLCPENFPSICGKNPPSGLVTRPPSGFFPQTRPPDKFFPQIDGKTAGRLAQEVASSNPGGNKLIYFT